MLARATWPGNVRELANVVERLVIVVPHAVVEVADVHAFAPGLAADPSPVAAAREQLVTLRQLERDYITYVIARCDGNKTKAAEILGIDVSTIHRRGRSGSQ